MDFEIWVYRGLIALLIAVIWWVVRRWAQNISDKFDLLIDEIRKIGEKSSAQEVRIGTLEKRADDHSIRIRNLEKSK